jgi:tetratricopeptide (TPR) repeat protein
MGKWEDAIYEYKDALDLDKTCVEAYFWMGQTYISAGQFVRAEEALKKALEINPDHSKSYESLKELQKISRVAVGQDEYAKIATLPAIDRADLAALFIKELELEKLFKTYNVKVDVGFKPPTPPLELPREAEVSEAEPQISDIEGHWAKGYIEKIIELGVMKPFPDQTFQPDQPITRATFALLIQDILSKIYHDDKLCTRHVGQESPFPDVRPDHWAFNAIMIVTTRGIMKAGLDGMFNMMDPVSGADALESLKILKSTLEK